jgi:hypothetical protein
LTKKNGELQPTVTDGTTFTDLSIDLLKEFSTKKDFLKMFVVMDMFYKIVFDIPFIKTPTEELFFYHMNHQVFTR